MSRVQELTHKIEEGNRKLADHQKEVTYWLKELSTLNQDLQRALREEKDKQASPAIKH